MKPLFKNLCATVPKNVPTEQGSNSLLNIMPGLYTEADVRRFLAPCGVDFEQAVAAVRNASYEVWKNVDLSEATDVSGTLKELAITNRAALRALASDFNRGDAGLNYAAQQAVILFPESSEGGGMKMWFGKYGKKGSAKTLDQIFLEDPQYIVYLRTLVGDYPDLIKPLSQYPVAAKSNKRKKIETGFGKVVAVPITPPKVDEEVAVSDDDQCYDIGRPSR